MRKAGGKICASALLVRKICFGLSALAVRVQKLESAGYAPGGLVRESGTPHHGLQWLVRNASRWVRKLSGSTLGFSGVMRVIGRVAGGYRT